MAKNKHKSGHRRPSGNVLARNRKTLMLSGGALLLAVGGYKLMNLSQLNKELEIQQSAKVYRVSFTGITVRIDVVLKNPTPGQISVKTPYITMAYNGEPFASSDNISPANHQVPAYGQVPLDPIFITLSYLDLALKAKNVWQQYQSGGKAVVTVRALTRINDVFPVEKTTTFDLGASPTNKAPGAADGVSGLGRLLPDAPVLSRLPEAFTPQRREHTRRRSS